ncbi:MAG: hypothetical protein Q8T09_12415 [Candidatus Melainabacteria bacterium]|nr:hypothetical protein [Candidatus Melainabacteria bacterium]
MSDNSELGKKKGEQTPLPPAPAEAKDPAAGYSFFVNEPGNSQYNYGLDVSLSDPVSLPGYTAYVAAASPAAPLSQGPVTQAVLSSPMAPSAPVSASTFNPNLDYAPVYSAAAAEMAREHERDDIQIDADRPSVSAPAISEVAFAKPESIEQNVSFSHSANVTQGVTVFENATFGLEASVAQTAASIVHAELIQDAAPIQNAVPLQNVAPVLSAFTIENAAPIQNAVPVLSAFTIQNAEPIQDALPVQNAAPVQNAMPVQNAAPVQNAMPVQNIEHAHGISTFSSAGSHDANSLRSWGVVKPEPPPDQDVGSRADLSPNQSESSDVWPSPQRTSRSQVSAKSGTPVPLHLATDKRFAQLALAPELAATVDRIYSLVDLDFSGYVDFPEMSSVLSSDHLSDSEKSFVRMIYAVGCKILGERPAVSSSTVPVLTQDDFRRAFAYQCANTLGADAKSKGVLASAAQGREAAPRFTEIKPTLYADNDYPQMSLQPGAVRLGTMGDAFFAAGVSSLAESRPRALLRILSENLDHSFSVAFPGAHGNPLDVMPPRPEEIIRYGLVAKYGFWFPLLEKAYGIHLAQKHRLASKLSEPRNEAFARSSQVIETLTAAFTGTLVTADCSPQDLLLQLSDLIARKRIVIAVSSDFVPESSSFAGTAPAANKPYPLTGFDRQRGYVFLSSIYGHDTHHEEEPLRFTAEQFLQYFKVIYFEQEAAPAAISNLMRTTQKQSLNPWKKS